MRVGSLFSGVGLGDFGLMLAGMEIAWQVEIDDYCQKILELRWPGIPRWRDVKDVHGVAAHAKLWERNQGRCTIRREAGNVTRSTYAAIRQIMGQLCPSCLSSVDLIIGGPPCQPFSLAGKRSGTSDNRYLWPEMFRIVRDVGPRWVVFENVPGVEEVVESVVVPDLESLSYETWWLEIPAQALEACHRRMRVWVIAHASQRGQQDGAEQNQWQEQPGQQAPRRSDARGCHFRQINWHVPPPEPTVRGVDDAGPNIVDRLKGLGNGMDVRSAYEIGRIIMEYDQGGKHG